MGKRKKRKQASSKKKKSPEPSQNTTNSDSSSQTVNNTQAPTTPRADSKPQAQSTSQPKPVLEPQTPPHPQPNSKTKSKTSMDAPTERSGNSNLPRYVSFVLLVGVIGILSIVFFQVMSRFIIPLFLSALLVVIFRPLHTWINNKIGGRDQIAALLTTLAILLAVLVPLAGLLFLAASEGRDVLRQFNAAKILDDISHVRTNMGLDMPSARELREIEEDLTSLTEMDGADRESLDQQSAILFEIQEESVAIARQQELPWPVEILDSAEPEFDPTTQPKTDLVLKWEQFAGQLLAAKEKHASIGDPDSSQSKTDELIQSESDANLKQASKDNERKHEKVHEYQKSMGQIVPKFLDFKYRLLGGRSKSMLIETVNPTTPQLQSYTKRVVTYLRDKLFILGGSIGSFLGNTLFGAAIMIIGLYFFLLDGPGMVESLKGLSPIDDEHEQELVSEFGRVSRAVVLATLLSALVQGLLAGVGFYVAGLDSIFLLTLLSAVLAMVPFVGAAAVWVPCALYLYFFDNNLVGAIGLAVYGVAVISMADNIIKPWILHGQSNLHPLLALLSVLGGVAVLGPIGILIGPMIVAFLQTLLKILQRELDMMSNDGNVDSPVNEAVPDKPPEPSTT